MDDARSEADQVCELVTAACELVERGATLDARDPRAVAEAALLHAELTGRVGCIEDAELADDAAGAAVELGDLVTRLDALPPRAPALTG